MEWDGTIHASNGEFSGHIEADSGRIGQWYISTDNTGSLESENGNIVLNPIDNGGQIKIGDNMEIYGSSSTIFLGSKITLSGKNSQIIVGEGS